MQLGNENFLLFFLHLKRFRLYAIGIFPINIYENKKKLKSFSKVDIFLIVLQA